MNRLIRVMSLIVLGLLIYSWFSPSHSWQHALAFGIGAIICFCFAWQSRIQEKEFFWVSIIMGLWFTTIVVNDLTGYLWPNRVMSVVFVVTFMIYLFRVNRQASVANNVER